ncbi:MAG: CDP-alcohol phosphatidyltransferase family protein [Clostridia bacterium]|nr:CDP-alcohol phosphatidyltransferase family protein [Clostridia bacterium]
MIGYYNYTVILTYVSLISASTGIFVSLSGNGHPYVGIIFLMISGMCDAFDGKVASTNKNRSNDEKLFGIQIDSLSDLVAFGVLPACIGVSLLKTTHFIDNIGTLYGNSLKIAAIVVIYLIFVFFVLAGMIRLAYFNVTECNFLLTAGLPKKHFTGLPITTSSMIFPTILLIQYFIKTDITAIFYLFMLITGIAFIVPFKVKKPTLKWVLIMIGIGLAELFFIINIFLKC